MAKNKIIHIQFPVFCNYRVHVEITGDLAATCKKYPETTGVVIEDTDAICIHVKGDSRSFVFIQFGCTPGTVAHESWHVVRRMMEYMGVELDNEVVAYHLGY